MRLATLESAVIDWLMKVVMPTLPGYVQLGAGFIIPTALKRLEKMIDDNSAYLKDTGVLRDDGHFCPEKLRESFAFPFQYKDKIEIEVGGVNLYITKQNVDEIISTAERIEQSQ